MRKKPIAVQEILKNFRGQRPRLQQKIRLFSARLLTPSSVLTGMARQLFLQIFCNELRIAEVSS
jgi:hypothetical protein